MLRDDKVARHQINPHQVGSSSRIELTQKPGTNSVLPEIANSQSVPPVDYAALVRATEAMEIQLNRHWELGDALIRQTTSLFAAFASSSSPLAPSEFSSLQRSIDDAIAQTVIVAASLRLYYKQCGLVRQTYQSQEAPPSDRLALEASMRTTIEEETCVSAYPKFIAKCVTAMGLGLVARGKIHPDAKYELLRSLAGYGSGGGGYGGESSSAASEPALDPRVPFTPEEKALISRMLSTGIRDPVANLDELHAVSSQL